MDDLEASFSQTTMNDDEEQNTGLRVDDFGIEDEEMSGIEEEVIGGIVEEEIVSMKVEVIEPRIGKSRGRPTLAEKALEISKEDIVYCFCKGDDAGKMICCDYKKCKIKWFHFECVKINEAPRDKWFCSECA